MTEEQIKERLRIRRENEKIEEKPKTGEGSRWQTVQVGRGDRRRKKNKTGE